MPLVYVCLSHWHLWVCCCCVGRTLVCLCLCAGVCVYVSLIYEYICHEKQLKCAPRRHAPPQFQFTHIYITKKNPNKQKSCFVVWICVNWPKKLISKQTKSSMLCKCVLIDAYLGDSHRRCFRAASDPYSVFWFVGQLTHICTACFFFELNFFYVVRRLQPPLFPRGSCACVRICVCLCVGVYVCICVYVVCHWCVARGKPSADTRTTAYVCVCMQVCLYVCVLACVYVTSCSSSFSIPLLSGSCMGWLRWEGSLKLQVSLAKEPCKKVYILQKRPGILRSVLIVATPYPFYFLFIFLFLLLLLLWLHYAV